MRMLQRMEKEYQKYSKQYTEEVNRARKELDKVAEKTKKMVLNGYTTTNLSAMQQQLQDRVADLESLRMHMLKQVMIEERRRLIVILIGQLRSWCKLVVVRARERENARTCKNVGARRGEESRGRIVTVHVARHIWCILQACWTRSKCNEHFHGKV